MYLSRLILNVRDRRVRRDLADCHELHRTILRGFPGLAEDASTAKDARARLGVLYRVETDARTGGATVLVQSAVAPDWSRLPSELLRAREEVGENPATKPIGRAIAGIRTGDELVFRLRANPTRRIDTKSGPNGERRNGRRVELRTEAEQLGWLMRKAETGGFALRRVQARSGRDGWPDVLAVGPAKVTGARLVEADEAGAARRQRLTFGEVLFEGRLVVTDAEAFRETLATGIGSGKAYGFGLLSVARVGSGE